MIAEDNRIWLSAVSCARQWPMVGDVSQWSIIGWASWWPEGDNKYE
jgi:hypothetical protein